MNVAIGINVSGYSTLALQHVRRTLEAELLDFCATGLPGTQAHIGKLDLLGAVGAELLKRNALVPPPPYVEVNMEDGFKISRSVRVF